MTGGPKRTLDERFFSKVYITSGCWLWIAGLAGKYGYFYFDGRMQLAHRVMFEQVFGPITPGMTIDHVRSRGCTSTLCVRPEHLEEVSLRENILRSDSICAVHARATHCPQGHPYDETNTVVHKSTGGRVCRECNRLRAAQQRAKRWA